MFEFKYFFIKMDKQITFDEIEDQNRCSRIQHNLGEIFDYFFPVFRDKKINILVIGVQRYNSIGNFKKYFNNATIYGMDIDKENKKYEEDRIKILIGDQRDMGFLSSIPIMNIVVDDGIQSEDPTVKTLDYIFKNKMTNPGLYLIQKNWMKDKRQGFSKMLEFFSGLDYTPPGYIGPWSQLNHLENEAPDIAKNTIGIHFYRNLTIIQRGRNPEDLWAAKRLKYPELCKNNELSVYGKELNDWSHINDPSKMSRFGSSKIYEK